MKLACSLEELAGVLGQAPRTAVTIGVFDGLHCGHQRLIRKTVETAREQGLTAVVITFAEHPLRVLAPPYAPKRLISARRKTRILSQLGADLVWNVTFTPEFASQAPRQFVEDVLCRQCGMCAMVCGYDFSFGRAGAGNVDLLRQLSTGLGFRLEVLEPVSEHSVAVKSTQIRDLLFSGRVEEASHFLTRPFELEGEVATGFGRGREIGFPTANLSVSADYCLPARGVYFCLANVSGSPDVQPAMVNIGFNPTFGADRLSVEAHLIGYSGKLVGRLMSLFFLKRLRDERKFPDVSALVAQLQADREICLKLASERGTACEVEKVRCLVAPAACGAD